MAATDPAPGLPQAELVADRGAFELRGWISGAEAEGPSILCLHETAGSAELWRPLATALSGRARLVAYDRRGWGRSGAPEDYRRTTIEEQALDVEAVIEALGAGPPIVCGAGLGAVVALELSVHRAELVSAALLIEPPLLALVPEATATISADVEAIRRTTAAIGTRLDGDAGPREAAAAGARAALELYLGGGLGALGLGAERIPGALADPDQVSPYALFAEVAAISGWTLPLGELPSLGPPVAVVIADSTPPFVRRAAESLTVRLPGADMRELPAAGLPQLDCPDELAEVLLELA